MPPTEYSHPDRPLHDLGRDLVAEAEQHVDVDVPAVRAVGGFDRPGPAEQPAEQVGVLLPRGPGGDGGPRVPEGIPAALPGLDRGEFDLLGLGGALVDVPPVRFGYLDPRDVPPARLAGPGPRGRDRRGRRARGASSG